ncbi:MAG: PKD-like domain-containing protein, partial [Ferruginibacter sp.]
MTTLKLFHDRGKQLFNCQPFNLKLPSFFSAFTCLFISFLMQFNTTTAQVTVCTSCSAKDINVLSVELVQLNPAYASNNSLPKYLSLPATCSGAEQITGVLKITVDQNASTRYGFRVFGDILVDGQYSSMFSYCDPSDFTSGTYSNIYVENSAITWTCGTKLEINNLFIGWEINNGTLTNPKSACTPTDPCDLGPHCKQFTLPAPPIVVVTPLGVNFTATGACPAGKTVQTYSFDALAVPGGTTGGTVPYPANAFSWSIVNSSSVIVATMTGATPTYDFSSLGAGSYTVTLTVTDDLPAATSTKSKTINVISCCTAPVIGNQTPAAICSGGSVTLSAGNFTGSNTIPSGTTYSWSAPSTSGITGLGSGADQTSFTTGSLTNTTNGSIDVIYTVTPKSANCSGSSFIVTVTVNPVVNAGTNGTLTICTGTTPTEAQLFAALGGSPAAGGIWSGPVSGVYTYTVAAIAPCTAATATVTVTEQAQPNAGTNGLLTVCAGTTPTNAELFAKLGGSPATGGSWTGPVSGVYTYTVAATAPCTLAATSTVTVTEQAQPNAGTNGLLTVCAGTTPTN